MGHRQPVRSMLGFEHGSHDPLHAVPWWSCLLSVVPFIINPWQQSSCHGVEGCGCFWTVLEDCWIWIAANSYDPCWGLNMDRMIHFLPCLWYVGLPVVPSPIVLGSRQTDHVFCDIPQTNHSRRWAGHTVVVAYDTDGSIII